MKIFVLILALSLGLNSYALNHSLTADEFDSGFDNGNFDDNASEFESEFDNTDVEIINKLEPEKPSSISGIIELEANYNIANNRNLSSLKSLVSLDADYKFNNGYKFKSTLKAYKDLVFNLTNNYSTTPKSYGSEINLNQFSFEGSFNPRLDFKIGRQIVVWGKSDAIRITDILNPIDNRNPGLTDIKNLRLGRFMSKFDYYFDKFNLSTILLHENNFSKNPKFGSDFKSSPDLSENTPSNSLKNTGIALSLTGAFSSYDIALYFADTYIDKSYLKNNILQFDNKSKMFGFAYNKVVGSFLLKTEAAYFDNIKYTNVLSAKSRLDSLIGIEYSGIRDGSISYELALKNINNYDSNINTAPNLWTKKESYQHALRFSQSYLNQVLDLNAIFGVFGKSGKDGGFARISLDYALNDEISINGGVIDYLSGGLLDDSNDRVFAKISYSF